MDLGTQIKLAKAKVDYNKEKKMKETKIVKENVWITFLKEKELPNWAYLLGIFCCLLLGIIIGSLN